MNSQNIKKKIKALLAIKENESSSINEAKVASEKLQKLLNKHNLSLAELDNEISFENIGWTMKQTDFAEISTWANTLGEKVAECFECRMLYDPTPKGIRFYFFGVGPKPDIAGYYFGYLCQVLTAEADKAFKEAQKIADRENRIYNPGNDPIIRAFNGYNIDKESFIASFIVEATKEITSRLWIVKRPTIGLNGTCTALVKMEIDKVNEYINEKLTVINRGETKTVQSNLQGMRAGKQFGNTLALNEGIKE